MTFTISREIRLKNRPEGMPRETDFELVEVELPEIVGKEWKDTIVDGIENAPKAFIGLFKGQNFGKMIVKISSDPGN